MKIKGLTLVSLEQDMCPVSVIDDNIKKKSTFTGYMFLVILYLLTGSTPSTGAELANIVVRNAADELLIDVKLKGVFSEKMKAAVSKGIAVDIEFSVSLYEVHIVEAIITK
jgi:hypothetical protein